MTLVAGLNWTTVVPDGSDTVAMVKHSIGIPIILDFQKTRVAVAPIPEQK
jgi:hypothetical protein